MDGFGIHRLSPALGAEIRGLDLARPLDHGTVAALRAAWLEHLVLVFRNQSLTEADQVAFAQLFGMPVGSRSTERKDGGDSRVMLVSNVRENGKPVGVLPDGELMFHADSVFLEKPLKGALLYAQEIPREGGNTLFANMYMAWDSLPDAVRSRIRTVDAVHAYDYSTQIKTAAFDRSRVPHAVHPAVCVHPETGREVLHVNRLMTEELVGLNAEDGRAVLELCFAHVERPEHLYEHVWQIGDLVMWDNRCTQHARTDFAAGERRLLRRVGLEGERLPERRDGTG